MAKDWLTRGLLPVLSLETSARALALLLLFAFTGLFSAATLLPGLSNFRYPYYERYLDLFFVLVLVFGSVRSPRRPLGSKSAIVVLILIALSFVTAILRFGPVYVFVEYRQYLMLGFSMAYMTLAQRRLSAERLASTFPMYFGFLVINFVLATVFQEYYRPGVFGESNYDLAYVACVLVAMLHIPGKKVDILIPLLLFALLSQSRTAVGVVMVIALLRASSVRGILFLAIVLPVAFYLLRSRLWGESSDGGDLLEQLDRVQMTLAYVDAVVDKPQLAILGQAFSGITFKADVLSFYLETQAASAALDFNTPSNFHGHMLRGFLLLGIPLYSAFLACMIAQAKRVHGRPAFVLLVTVIAVTTITQSIFAHPFAGTLFASVCVLGFAVKKQQAQQVQ